MSAEITASPFILLFRGTDWDRGLSAEEIQQTMSRWTVWFDRLTSEGKAKLGQPLTNDGKIVSGKKGGSVVDGPFTESKELVAGFALLKVNSKEEAIELTRKFLQVAGDGECELRQIYEADTSAPAGAKA